MALALPDALGAIEHHTRGLAEAAGRDLAAPVPTCPGWSAADLVVHVTRVHRFWATVVAERRQDRPTGDDRPDGVVAGDPVPELLAGVDRLVAVLGAADQSAAVWTWSPLQRNVAFVTRHQVQEALVHHLDALAAAGHPEPTSLGADPAVAADAVDEMLTRSLVLDSWPPEELAEVEAELRLAPDLPAQLVLHAVDTGDAWRVDPGAHHATVRVTRLDGPVADAVVAPAVELLLWLYGRIELDPVAVASADALAVAALRALCDTE